MENYRGCHIIIDLFGCDFDLLNDGNILENILAESALKAGCTILNRWTYQFEPQGVTSIIGLAESHVSLHTVPQENKAWLDFFSCGDRAKPGHAVQLLIEKLKPEYCNLQILVRH
jgi:S-adenosylmethionine decarboxylase proenzyme